MKYYISIFIGFLLLLILLTNKNQNKTPIHTQPINEQKGNQNGKFNSRSTIIITNKDNEFLARNTNFLPPDSVTNIYSFSSNQIIFETLEYPPVYKLLGTRKFETLAKNQFDKLIDVDPNLADIKEILEDFPASNDSSLIFSGIYLVHTLKAEISDQYYNEFQNRLSLEKDLQEAAEIEDIDEKEKRIELIKNSREVELFIIREKVKNRTALTKDLLIGLYGEMPKDVFQRLLSIETQYGPERLPYP